MSNLGDMKRWDHDWKYNLELSFGKKLKGENLKIMHGG